MHVWRWASTTFLAFASFLSPSTITRNVVEDPLQQLKHYTCASLTHHIQVQLQRIPKIDHRAVLLHNRSRRYCYNALGGFQTSWWWWPITNFQLSDAFISFTTDLILGKNPHHILCYPKVKPGALCNLPCALFGMQQHTKHASDEWGHTWNAKRAFPRASTVSKSRWLVGSSKTSILGLCEGVEER